MRPRPTSRPITILAGGVVAGLGLFHLQLLWSRVSEGALLRPAVSLRWALGLLALAGLLHLRRLRLPLLGGRRALGLWTLVLLLHWSAGSEATGRGPTPAELLAPLPVTITLATALLAISLLAAPTVRKPLSSLAGLGARRAERPRRTGLLLPSLPRPPPAPLS